MNIPATNWWTDLRAEFPYLRDHVFAWSGGQVPLATSVRAAMEQVIDEWESDPITLADREWTAFDAARMGIAELFQCALDRVAVSDSTSGALGLAAAMVLSRWQRTGSPPANVILHWDCHPASSYHWLNAVGQHPSLSIRWADRTDHDDPVEALVAKVDEETIAIVMTHVSWLSGAAFDLKSIGDKRKAADWALIVDAAQSAGVLPLGRLADRIDFIGFPGYKWLLGPPGTGFLVMADDWLEEPSPITGWAAVHDPVPADGRRFWPYTGGAGIRHGMPNFIPLAGSHAALQMLNRAGIERIADRVSSLSGRLIDGLDQVGYPPVTPRRERDRAGVCSVEVPDLPSAVVAMREHGIATIPEREFIRLDLHAFNSEEDVERIIACFASLRR